MVGKDKKRGSVPTVINRPQVDVPYRIPGTGRTPRSDIPEIDIMRNIVPGGAGPSREILEDLEREQAAKEAAALADPGPIIERPEVDVPYPSREDVPQVEEDPQMVEELGSIIDPSIAITRDAEPEFETTGEVETFETTVEPSPTDLAKSSPNKLVEFFREVISDDQDFREGRMKDPNYRKHDLRYGINWDVPLSTTEGIHFKLKDGSNLSVVPTENENEALIKDLYQTHQTRETEWGTREGVDRYSVSTADRITHLQQIARMADKTGTTLVAEIDPKLIFTDTEAETHSFAPIPQAEYIRDAYKGLNDPTIDGWEFVSSDEHLARYVDRGVGDKTVIKRKPQPFDAEWDMPVTKKEELIQRQKDWKEGGEQESQEREQRIAEEKRAAAAEKAATLADPGPPTYESRVLQRSDDDIENIRGHALADFKVTGGSPDSEVNQMISLMPRRSYYFRTIPFSGVTEWGRKPDQNSFWYRGFPVHRRTTGSAGLDKYYTIYAPDNRTLIFQGYTTEYTEPGTKYVPNHELMYSMSRAEPVTSRKVVKRIIDEYWTDYDKNTPDGALLTDPEKSVGEDYTKGQFEADMKALRLDEFLEAPHIGSVQQFHAGGFVEASTLSTVSPFIV